MAQQQQPHKLTVVYEDEKANCSDFLLNFRDGYMEDDDGAKYHKMLQLIKDRQSKTLAISLDDVEQYFESRGDPAFTKRCETNTQRYITLFAEAADKLVNSMQPTEGVNVEPDIWDVLAEQRRLCAAQAQAMNMVADLPASVQRRFDTYILPRSKMPITPLRQISASHIGHLVKLRGMVTHVTDVKALATVVVYSDPTTGNEVYQEVVGRQFSSLETTKTWQRKPKKGAMPPVLETRGSKFVRYQEARIQESADEVPEGATPRTISVQFKGQICRSAKQGDEIILCGIFLPQPITGYRGMKAGLLTSTYIQAESVTQIKQSYAQHVVTPDEKLQLERLAGEGDVYGRLARSLAPEIYGQEDVKKALLLAMVGGTSRSLPDGMRLRGDVHICMMGDPGVAKSQLLKHVARISPRAVYTTGKGSSGVGLTAAVMRNQVTKELVLEGGALVLADKGVCCIDEFDKMDESDRTAIHEVMEQQTVSIAKAGIATTLNTRTTVMAAANPAWGRYDKRRSPAENIAMPAALLSRFDILWLMLDEVDDVLDKQLAAHILNVHRQGAAPAPTEGQLPPIAPSLLRSYIALAKSYQPTIPEPLTEYIAAVYAEMRQLEAAAGADSASTYTTPRTLLSILRLAQAVAKLRFDSSVCQSDVDEALRLMRASKSSLADKGAEADRARREDTTSLCHRLICEEARRVLARTPTLEVVELPFSRLQAVTARYNVTGDQLRGAIAEYAELAVWSAVSDQDNNPVVHIEAADLSAAGY